MNEVSCSDQLLLKLGTTGSGKAVVDFGDVHVGEDYLELCRWDHLFVLSQLSRTDRTVAVCGVDTDACVMATALGLFDAEFETFVVSEYCQSFHHLKPKT